MTRRARAERVARALVGEPNPARVADALVDFAEEERMNEKRRKPVRLTRYGLAKVYEDMADAAKITRAKVRCDVCEREQEVNGAHALRDGWPMCHGYTMRLMPRDGREVPR